MMKKTIFAMGCLWALSLTMAVADPLPEGTMAPDFSLKDQSGQAHTLTQYRGKYVVLMFYPKDFTPGCTKQNCSMRDSFAEINRLGVTVLGISTDSAESHAEFAKEHSIPYPLLADEKGEIAKQFGVLNDNGMARRTTFILSPKGAVVKLFANAGTENHGEEVLAFLNIETKSADIETGKIMPDFRLVNVETGKEQSLYEVKEKKFIVIVWTATRCPILNAHNKRIVELANEYQARGVHFIGINSNNTEPMEEVKVHAQESHYPFPVLKDPGNKIADLYEANVTPEVFVLDDQFVLKYHGRIDDRVERGIETGNITKHDLKETLDRLLEGKPAPHTEMRALGCSIKRVKKRAS